MEHEHFFKTPFLIQGLESAYNGVYSALRLCSWKTYPSEIAGVTLVQELMSANSLGLGSK